MAKALKGKFTVITGACNKVASRFTPQGIVSQKILKSPDQKTRQIIVMTFIFKLTKFRASTV